MGPLATHLVEVLNLAATVLSRDGYDVAAERWPGGAPATHDQLMSAYESAAIAITQAIAAVPEGAWTRVFTVRSGSITQLGMPRYTVFPRWPSTTWYTTAPSSPATCASSASPCSPCTAPRPTRMARRCSTYPGRNTMIVEAQVTIKGSRAAVWAAMTDIENASETISGIEKIEILEKPASGLVGLKWRETRMLFGKPATAEKWITDAAGNEFYKTRAESDGFVFLSTTSISESSGGITLSSSHDSQPQGIVAGLLSIPMGLLFKGVAKRALLQDLNDIKSAVEQESSAAA